MATLLVLGMTCLASRAMAQLDADFTASVQTGEVPLSVTFHDATTGGTPLVYQWSFGDGGTAHHSTTTHVYTEPGEYDVTLTVVSAVFQSNTEVKLGFIVVEPAPLSPSFSVDAATGVNPHLVSFTNTTTGVAPDSWHWDFGDGQSSSAEHPGHAYTAPGHYTVTLTAQYAGQTESVTVVDAVVVEPAPLTLAVLAEPVVGDLPLEVSFTDASSGAAIDTWLWEFGDGATSGEQHPTHVYTSPGSFTVRLEAWVGQQQETLVLPALITVDPVPLEAGLELDAPAGVNPHVVSFTDTTTGTAPQAWLWEFGDGTTSEEQHPSHRYVAPGSFDVTLTVWVEAQSSTVTQAGAVTVAPAPIVPTIAAAPTLGPAPLVVAFQDRSTGAEPNGWHWDFGDGNSSTAQHPAHEYLAPGTYPVTLTTSVGDQQDTVSAPTVVRVGPFGGLFVQVGEVGLPSAYDNDWHHPVSVWGNTAIEGDRNGTALGPGSGRARVMERQPDGSWALVAELLADDGDSSDHFGYSVSVSGSTAFVGALADETLGSLSGAAYVFERTANGSWPQVAKLLASDGDAHDRFGTSVAVSGDLAAVGAFGADIQGASTGAVYLFARQPDGTWHEVQKLMLDGGPGGARFGESVSLDGRWLAVGAPGLPQGLFAAGAASVWRRGPDGLFAEEALLLSDDVQTGDWLGGTVALSGTRVLVGARHDDDLGTSSGAAFVFERQADGSWPQVAQLHPEDGAPMDHFGNTVAMEGDWAVVGAIGNGSAGGAYVFHREPVGAWSQVAKLFHASPPLPLQVGKGLDIWGTTIVAHGSSYLVEELAYQDRVGFFQLTNAGADDAVVVRQGGLVLAPTVEPAASRGAVAPVSLWGALPGDLVGLSLAPDGCPWPSRAPCWLPSTLPPSTLVVDCPWDTAVHLPLGAHGIGSSVQAWVVRPDHVEVSNIWVLGPD